MKKAILAQKVLASVLSIGLGGFVLPLAAQANSGLSENIETVYSNDYYVGSKGAENNVVIIDSDLNHGVIGGYVYDDKVIDNNVIISGGTVTGTVCGGCSWSGEVVDNTVNISGGTVTGIVYGGRGYGATGNSVVINDGTIEESVIGGKDEHIGRTATGNSVVISGGTIKGRVIGGDSAGEYANENSVNISGGTVRGDIYGGRGLYGATGNIITLSGMADVSGSSLYGGDAVTVENNKLIINGWSGKDVKGAYNFSDINLQNIKWQNGGTVLNITANDKSDALADTKINLNYDGMIISGGSNLSAGDSMTLIKGQDLGITDSNVAADGTFTAGVAIEGTGETEVDGNSISYTVTSVKMLDQIDLVAENRAVAAAFVNQGTDLINDSLDALSRDGKYGIKTFAAVHGNRSKYDVNSDLKINGWSSIVGVGNEKNIGNGDFSWGVFYENGSGNYRTYNEFNNEFFRGDGSLVYNGGGIAARFEQDNGVYTEGSLRAGMLKSEMTNALKDGAGNSYGYKSESTYYGAHIGVGKIISLNEATDLDVYGKFFHTYTDGDSFTVANDKFEFDSINSDRLRIGARLTTNKENKFSTYYGLAYEYEFNGDADMRAQNMSAPEQSLKGSSCMAEIGMNYKPSSESPWSFDLSMRGYAGQRDGFSGNVQATYTF